MTLAPASTSTSLTVAASSSSSSPGRSAKSRKAAIRRASTDHRSCHKDALWEKRAERLRGFLTRKCLSVCPCTCFERVRAGEQSRREPAQKPTFSVVASGVLEGRAVVPLRTGGSRHFGARGLNQSPQPLPTALMQRERTSARK